MPPRKGPGILTPREARFCSEYLIDYNGSQAAIRAGYSAKGSNVSASKMLARPNICAEVERQKALQVARTGISADIVLRELAKIATSNPARYITVNDLGELVPDFARMTPDDMATISSVEFDTITERRPKARKGRMKGGGRPRDDAPLSRAVVSKIRHWDKKGALELLGRHFRLFALDAPAPPPPADNSKRATIINILVQNLNEKARRVHAEVVEQPPAALQPQPRAIDHLARKPNGKGNGHL